MSQSRALTIVLPMIIAVILLIAAASFAAYFLIRSSSLNNFFSESANDGSCCPSNTARSDHAKQILHGNSTPEYAGLEGTTTFSNVAKVSIDVANGVAVCEQAELNQGETQVSWHYVPEDGAILSTMDAGLKTSQQNGVLRLKDWRCEGKRRASNNAKIYLTLYHAADVELVEISQGNGELRISSGYAREISLGNGTLTLSGAPKASVDASVGNGKLVAEWLLAEGDADVSVGNGTAIVKLLHGSSVAVEATTGIGGIDAPAAIAVQRPHMLGATANGVFATGDTKLDISVGNGTVKIIEP